MPAARTDRRLSRPSVLGAGLATWHPPCYRATEAAKRVVDLAIDVAGGGGLFRESNWSGSSRDVRAGMLHPANSALTHEIVGKTALGLLGQKPRLVTGAR